jgi:hypothetical protein
VTLLFIPPLGFTSQHKDDKKDDGGKEMSKSLTSDQVIATVTAALRKCAEDHPVFIDGKQLYLVANLTIQGFEPKLQIEISDGRLWKIVKEKMPDDTLRLFIGMFEGKENLPIPKKFFVQFSNPLDHCYRVNQILRRLHLDSRLPDINWEVKDQKNSTKDGATFTLVTS